MSWKFVYNSNNLVGANLDKAVTIAEMAGYQFIVFNGIVYYIADGTYFKTNIKSTDLF